MELEKTKVYLPEEYSIYKVRLYDVIHETKNAYSIDAQILLEEDSIALKKATSCFVKLYFEKDSSLLELHCDDEILVYTALQALHSDHNFESLEYDHYLRYKGFSRTGYVSKGCWSFLLRPKKHSLKHNSLYYQHKIIDEYRKWCLDKKSFSILSALTVGYKESLPNDLKDSFSLAGVSHVLALSGLHVGFICLFFLFLIRKVSQSNRFVDILGKVFLIGVLWGFAFLVGCTPSVVRSVFMFSLLTVSSLVSCQTNSKQTLCVTAFIMLLYNPLWLFDVGFQLSFVAVLSILLFFLPLYNLLVVKTKVGKYIWNICSVSLTAQLGVLPLTLYYFDSFPVCFLVGNLIIIPLISIVLYLCFFSMLTITIPFIHLALVSILNKTLILLCFLVDKINQIPYSSIKNIWISLDEVVFLFLFLIAVGVLLNKPKYKNLMFTLISFALFLLLHIYTSYNSKIESCIEFYNVRNCPAIHCINANKDSYLVLIDDKADTFNLFKTMDKHWMHYRLHPLCITDSSKINTLFYHKPLLVFHNIKGVILNYPVYENRKQIKPINVDFIYICKGFRGSLNDLFSYFITTQIIIDSSLPHYLQRQLFSESIEKNVVCIPLLTKGSYTFSL